MDISANIKRLGLGKAIDYAIKDPKKIFPKLLDWADKFSGGGFERERVGIRKIIEDPSNPYYSFIYDRLLTLDPEMIKKVGVNFFINSALEGWKKQDEYREKYQCNIPWAILLDPTSACNLHCIGCWAAEYGNKLNLSYDEIDDIIRQGKEMGVYMYIYTGGEPLVRKKDLIKLCEKHDDCIFLSFTNSTLIDEAFADEMLRVKNFIPAISLEGNEETTDARRGKGVYQSVMRATQLLRERRLPFGFSCCYTSQNWDAITSDEYFQKMIDLGAYFTWYFHFMPTGMASSPELMPNPEQRTAVMRRIRKARATKPLFLLDFQNDGEYVGGCIAGGRRYLHINARGDVDPCVFIHYSDSNIREKSLLDCLRSPMFMAYHDGQPFNDNQLKPCPMLENPDALPEMVKKAGAHSTDPEEPEPVDHLRSKTVEYAKNWGPVADQLWEERKAELRAKYNLHD